MKYERRTDPRFVPATMLMCSGKCVALEIYNRLAELEDKIERGELVEVPKGAVVLTPEERAEEMRICNEERKQLERRAEVAERALRRKCESEADSTCPCDENSDKCKVCAEKRLCSTEYATQCYYEMAIHQAEREIKEEERK